MELCHLRQFHVPVGVLRLDGYDTTLNVVYVVLVLLEGHGNDCHIYLLVDALGLEAVLENDICLVAYLLGLLNRLHAGLNGLHIGHCRAVAHEDAEEGEEHEKEGEAEEHDAHGKNGDAKSMRVFTLQLCRLCLDNVGQV